MRAFVDTNVFIYASQPNNPKCAAAEAVVFGGGVVSVQVINEFANVTRKKLKRPWHEIEAGVALIIEKMGKPRDLTLLTHEAALSLAAAHNVAFYDALIVASALEASCDVLISDDFQDGRRFGDLLIRNPF